MNRWIAAMLVGFLTLAAAGAQAADKAKAPGEAREGSWRDDARKRHFAERMGITEAQGDKLEAAFKEHRKAIKPLRRELRDAMFKLRDQVEDEAGDEALKATLDRLSKARDGMTEERNRFHKKLADILPPTQQAKLLLARGHMRMMGRMGHGGGKMPGGFKGRRGGHGGHGGPGGFGGEEREDIRLRIRDGAKEDDDEELAPVEDD